MMEEKSEMLLRKYYDGNVTPEEEELLEKWFLQFNVDEQSKLSDFELQEAHDRTWEVLEKQIKPSPIHKLWPKIAIAASLILLLGLGLFFYKSTGIFPKVQRGIYANDIAPGKQGATLTLANGLKIKLSDASSGKLALEAGVVITKTEDGHLAYEMQNSQDGADKKNTLSTANGETYQVRLPDGSLVWLNAASSLSYSANLIKQGRRQVKLVGEAYFEIAKDKAHPFVVESQGQEVEVLGTHFNINAYGDEPSIKTTLLEGSIKVDRKIIIKPGQQAVSIDGKILVRQADVESALDWHRGDFVFDDDDFKATMRKISRWYDVEVVYDHSAPEVLLPGGWISRSKSLSAVIKIMELTGKVHFKIEGRRIVVTK